MCHHRPSSRFANLRFKLHTHLHPHPPDHLHPHPRPHCPSHSHLTHQYLTLSLSLSLSCSLSLALSLSLSLSLSLFLSPGLWCRGFLPYTARSLSLSLSPSLSLSLSLSLSFARAMVQGFDPLCLSVTNLSLMCLRGSSNVMSLYTGWQCKQKCHLCSSVESWINYYYSKGQAPFKKKSMSPILKVPGLGSASRALVDSAHTWHMGPLCCRLPRLMSCMLA